MTVETDRRIRSDAEAPESTPVWHIITCEYPPQSGGVSDYSYLVAQGLAQAGNQVHVWCPGTQPRPATGVNVHSTLGRFAPGDLRATSRALDGFPEPRHLLVQWVPHGYGYKSLNLLFCLWLWRRSRRGDKIDLVIHEPFLPFKKGSWRQNAAAMLHRVMLAVLLHSAWRVWLSTPVWEEIVRPFSIGRRIAYHWLPMPSNVPVVEDPAAVLAMHEQYAPGGLLIGHFGTFGDQIRPMLQATVPALLRRVPAATIMLLGPGSTTLRDRLAQAHPDLDSRLAAAGFLEQTRLSTNISACDLMIQPYPDGVTSRRSSMMAALSHGRPTVTTTGALTEAFWSASGAVSLAPAEDPCAFVDNAARLLEDLRQRLSLGEAAREFYRREFDVQHSVARLNKTDALAGPL
jgi:glycosyltransferase involved in cell wall biosynthesis